MTEKRGILFVSPMRARQKFLQQEPGQPGGIMTDYTMLFEKIVQDKKN